MPPHRKPTKHRLLVNRLNTLLSALHLPIVLKSPTDLTPPLLITILEAILCTRFPLDLPASREAAALHQTKMFLGSLETDVLEMDVGLSNMDPRRLANCEWEEVLFIGELLCWVCRRHGITQDDDIAPTAQARAPSHSPTMSTSTKHTYTSTSFSSHRNTESITRLDSLETIALLQKPISTSPSPVRPRCIHEISSPSLILSPPFPGTSSSHVSNAPQSHEQTVRYAGYISPVDEELELLSFESSRSVPSRNHCYEPQTSSASLLTALEETRARTLFLKQERARLLAELAKFKNIGI